MTSLSLPGISDNKTTSKTTPASQSLPTPRPRRPRGRGRPKGAVKRDAILIVKLTQDEASAFHAVKAARGISSACLILEMIKAQPLCPPLSDSWVSRHFIGS